MREEGKALLHDLEVSGCDGARGRMQALLTALRPPLDEPLVRRVLEALRSQRCFALLEAFAAAAAPLAQGELTLYARRQQAQALIDLGELDRAVALLEPLEPGAGKQRSEVVGLLGRLHKQRFVGAVAAGGKGAEELRASVDAYRRVYDLDPAWHGANLVALVARAERDGIDPGTDGSEVWARRLLAALEARSRPAWSAWDHAAAGEAWLALRDRDEVASAFASYWSAPGADAFALAGTARQLREIWQLRDDSGVELEAALLLQLEARMLAQARGGAHFTVADLRRRAVQLQAASGRAEATFGAGSAIPLERMLRLLAKARAVCRVVDVYDPSKGGTGFLVDGRALLPPRDGALLLTNHHVLHGPEAGTDLLAGEDYRGSIDVGRARAEFHYWGGAPGVKTVAIARVIHASPRQAADFALAQLAEPMPADRALTFTPSPEPLGSRNVVDPQQRARVVVVGHPQGRDLAFSVSDDEVVDHELDGKPHQGPRRIHYRTPTEPGSSGSPVLLHDTLEVVGLHRTGRARPLRADWPRARPDELYEANEAVAIRSVAEMAELPPPGGGNGGGNP